MLVIPIRLLFFFLPRYNRNRSLWLVALFRFVLFVPAAAAAAPQQLSMQLKMAMCAKLAYAYGVNLFGTVDDNNQRAQKLFNFIHSRADVVRRCTNDQNKFSFPLDFHGQTKVRAPSFQQTRFTLKLNKK